MVSRGRAGLGKVHRFCFASRSRLFGPSHTIELDEQQACERLLLAPPNRQATSGTLHYVGLCVWRRGQLAGADLTRRIVELRIAQLPARPATEQCLGDTRIKALGAHRGESVLSRLGACRHALDATAAT